MVVLQYAPQLLVCHPFHTQGFALTTLVGGGGPQPPLSLLLPPLKLFNHHP